MPGADHPAVVFLFSDIEGSTRLWEQQPAAMASALAAHDALARAAVAHWRGRLVKGTGDGIHAAFADAGDALGAMLQLQRGLAAQAAAGALPLALRCGLHQGTGQARDGDFFGPEVNRAARIMAAAHGGQMLLSQAVAEQLLPSLPAGVQLRDLGEVALRDLNAPERLWQVLAPPLRCDFPPLRQLQAVPHNLPQPLNRFIGREAVLPALQRLLGEHRLLTLLGTGGIGKSRLAVQLAAGQVAGQPAACADGAWFVELAPLAAGPAGAQRLPQVVASVLGVMEEPGRSLDDSLARHVAGRRLLLVLDNCEHVLDAAAALAKRLLQAGAGVRVLATSREPLRVAGELAWPVPALGLPEVHALTAPPEELLQHGAVRLFVDRAQLADPGFTLHAGNAPAVADICRRLDGIALALELAAARVRMLPPPLMATRLRDSLALLSTRDSTVAPRQRTLQALIDWSCDLLAPAERLLYRRLSVFAGGFTLEAAEAVCADAALPLHDIAELLAALVDKSLVQVQPGADTGPRLRLLETVLQHAAALLAGEPAADDPQEVPALRRRHAQACLALAEAAQQQLGGAHQAAALARLDSERDNLLAALAWCAADAAERAGGDALADPAAARSAAGLGLRLSFALRPYWLNRGLLSLGLDTTAALLAHPGAMARDSQRARALFNLGQLCCFMGRYAEAMPPLLECLDIARECGDAAREAAVLQPLGMAASGLGDASAARRYADEAVAAARVLGNPRQLAAALNALAQLDRMEQRLEAAQSNYAAALALAEGFGDQEYVAGLRLNLAMVALTRRDTATACQHASYVMRIVDSIGSRPAAVGVLDVCTGLSASLGDMAQAALWHGLAEAESAQAGLRRDAADAAFLAPHLAAMCTALGERFEAAVNAGRETAPDAGWRGLSAWLDGVSRSSGTDPAASVAGRPR